MPVCLNGGSLSDLGNNWAGSDSMAKDIETAMAGFIPRPPDDKPDERRKFFMGLANGIINYLQSHQAAITVTVQATGVAQTVSVNIDKC